MRTLTGIKSETCRLLSCKKLIMPGDKGMPANLVISKMSRGWICEQCAEKLKDYGHD